MFSLEPLKRWYTDKFRTMIKVACFRISVAFSLCWKPQGYFWKVYKFLFGHSRPGKRKFIFLKQKYV